jgi:hypothetical protein
LSTILAKKRRNKRDAKEAAVRKFAMLPTLLLLDSKTESTEWMMEREQQQPMSTHKMQKQRFWKVMKTQTRR